MEKCTLLPTFSDEIITDRAGVRKYFEHFMAKNPEGTIVSKEKGKRLADSLYYSVNNYDFVTKYKDGGATTMHITHARYDFIWIKIGG